MERDTRCDTIITFDSDNFNSHAHVERDKSEKTVGRYLKISTHTLTWSVTLAGSHGEILNFHFNSHAHVERDTLDVVYIWCLLNVMRTYFFI